MSNDVQAEMLILARESRALTQSDLARETGVSQANISKYESGLLNVSDEHLGRIAAALHYPKSFFYQTEKRYGFGSSCTYHRKRQTLPVNELKRLLAELNILRIRVSHLLIAADIESDVSFQHLDIDEFGGDVERIAQLVRNGWKLPPGPILNLVEAIENAGGIVVHMPFGTSKLDAISQWLPGVPPVFMVNSEIPGDRARFTLAHELGHVIMHDRTITEDMEQEADRFASEFLMPARDIAPALNSLTIPVAARLKPVWKVSMQALIRRAYDLGKITHRQYRSLFEQMGKYGYRITEPVSIPLEETATYDDLIDYHVGKCQYSREQMCQLLHILDDELETKGGLPEEQKKHVFDKRQLRLIREYGTG